MDLQVLVSKKGTRVVTASNLHKALELPDHHYGTNVRKWLNDVYQFRDGIRKPEGMRDYARRKVRDHIAEDYYLGIELAKLIALHSKSKVKQKCARWLYSLEDPEGEAPPLSPGQMKAMIELTKAMGLVSCQESAERDHLKTYKARNGGQPTNWWKYRQQILGYSLPDVKKKLSRKGVKITGRNGRELLMQSDKYEMIRTGVIELLMVMGKSHVFARRRCDLANVLTRKLKLAIDDERQSSALCSPNGPNELIEKVQSEDKEGFMHLWRA